MISIQTNRLMNDHSFPICSFLKQNPNSVLGRPGPLQGLNTGEDFLPGWTFEVFKSGVVLFNLDRMRRSRLLSRYLQPHRWNYSSPKHPTLSWYAGLGSWWISLATQWCSATRTGSPTCSLSTQCSSTPCLAGSMLRFNWCQFSFCHSHLVRLTWNTWQSLGWTPSLTTITATASDFEPALQQTTISTLLLFQKQIGSGA